MFYRLEIQNILILFKAVNVTKYQKKNRMQTMSPYYSNKFWFITKRGDLKKMVKTGTTVYSQTNF